MKNPVNPSTIIDDAVEVSEIEYADDAPWAVELVVHQQSFTLEMHEDRESAEWLAGQLRIALHRLIDFAIGDELDRIAEMATQDVNTDVGFVILGQIERAVRALRKQISAIERAEPGA